MPMNGTTFGKLPMTPKTKAPKVGKPTNGGFKDSTKMNMSHGGRVIRKGW